VQEDRRSYVPARIATHLSWPRALRVTHSFAKSRIHAVVTLFTGAVEWHLLPAFAWDCSCVGLTRDLPLFCVSNRVYIELQRCAGVQSLHVQYVPPGFVITIPRSVPSAPNPTAASSGNLQYAQLVEQTFAIKHLHLLENVRCGAPPGLKKCSVGMAK
jgi:hypothetical protein